MSRIDTYNEAKHRYDIAKEYLSYSNEPRYDKFGVRLKITDSYKGVYGSSGTSQWASMLLLELEKEVSSRLPEILEWIVDRLRKEMIHAKDAAQAEAMEVLQRFEEGNGNAP